MKKKQPKEWHDIRSDFEVMQRTSCVPAHIRKVPCNYIFDENQSVKWNRDKVLENNDAYEEGHACGINNIICHLDSVIDLFSEVLSEVNGNDKR